MRLFCVPYAGGSKGAYLKWSQYINPAIEIDAVEFKGRGGRFGEPFYNSFGEAVEDIYSYIKNKIENEEYAIYGHSMGAILAYELYYRIVADGRRKPRHIFFSGRHSPNVRSYMYVSHKMPDAEFMDRILALGGIPDDVSQSKEVLKFFLPILKNDIRILENYIYIGRNEKIQCNISVLNGTEDRIDPCRKVTWSDLCDKECKLYDFHGNHFFINSYLEDIAKIIESALLK